MRRRPLCIRHEILESANQILPALGLRSREHDWVGPGEVGRRPDVEELARRELDLPLVLLGDAMDAGRRDVPPLLIE